MQNPYQFIIHKKRTNFNDSVYYDVQSLSYNVQRNNKNADLFVSTHHSWLTEICAHGNSAGRKTFTAFNKSTTRIGMSARTTINLVVCVQLNILLLEYNTFIVGIKCEFIPKL